MAPLRKTTSNASSVGAPLGIMPAMGPGPIEIVFTFDTTGSMYRCLTEVREKLGDIIQRLFADIPNLKIAVFAHGDYCDKATYVTKYVDFTNDVNKLCQFVKNVKSTGGGDWEECYELVLKQSRELLSWTPGTQRALVMIGDAIPHPASDAQNKDNIDWKEEAEKLRDQMGVRVYAVQAYENATAKSFWSDLAKITFGKHLNLGQFETIVDMMMAICYREGGAEFFEAYEKEVRAREGPGIRRQLDCMFHTLRDGEASSSTLPAPSAPFVAPPLLKTASTLGKGGAKRKTGMTKVHKPKATLVKKTSFKKTTTARKILKKAIKTAATDDNVTYTLGKQLRETVHETCNEFGSLNWSKWKMAMAPSAPTSEKKWIPRRNGQFGVRDQSLYSSGFDTPAVYEMAVQTGKGRRMYPLYLRSTQGSGHHGNWDSYLMRNKCVNDNTSEVLRKGCKLFVRRATFDEPVSCNGQVANSVKELKALMKDTYDYAWAKKSFHNSCRKVVRKGIVISQ